MAFVWVFFALLVGSALIWTFLRRETTPVVLVVFVGCGTLISYSSLRKEIAGQSQLENLSPPVSVLLTGYVSSADSPDDSPQRFVVRRPSIESEAGKFLLDGDVLVLLVPRGDQLTTQVPLLGEYVELTGALDLPQTYQNFFGPNYRQRLAQRGIYAVVRTSRFDTITPPGLKGRFLSALHNVRRYATATLNNSLPPNESRWLTSMLFNDRRILRPHETRWLRNSNMFHLFAVSGLHVSALAAVFLLILRALRLSWPSAWLMACILVWCYVALTDFVPSALRAASMLTAYAATTWLRREIDLVTALTVGCFALLLAQPNLLWEPAFLLSAAGVLGIITFFPILQKILPISQTIPSGGHLRAILKPAHDAALVTLAVTLFLLPMQLHFFNQINLLSPLTNVFAAILCGPLVASGLATIAASLLSQPLAVLIGTASSALMQLLEELVRFTAEQTWAILHLPQLPLPAVFAYYASLTSGYYLVSRDSPEFIPKARARLAIHVLVGFAILMISTAWQRADRRLHIWFFDVGQGDAALMRLPTGHTLLIDTGNNIPNMARQVVIPQLSALGCWPLDYLVLTHEDSDHTGSAPTIIEEWNVKKMIVSNDMVSADRFFPTTTTATALPTIIRVCAGYRVVVESGLELEVLNPSCSTSPSLSSNNERSLVLCVRYRNFSVLMTGDAERQAELEMLANNLPPCDVLKVAHHGSASSSTDAFLDAVRPQIAVISCGRRNHYGHPSPAVLKRLETHGARVYRTDRDGAVWVATDGNRIEVRSAALKSFVTQFLP
ncbi:MAG: DNA internalization-related competence protein ComEC/Rec2 [Candidatus Sumerlaeaceae bacterium]